MLIELTKERDVMFVWTKEFSPMLVTVDGKVMSIDSDSHPANARAPMVRRPSTNVTVFKPRHRLNASEPMDFTFDVNVIEVIASQFEYVFGSTSEFMTMLLVVGQPRTCRNENNAEIIAIARMKRAISKRTLAFFNDSRYLFCAFLMSDV